MDIDLEQCLQFFENITALFPKATHVHILQPTGNSIILQEKLKQACISNFQENTYLSQSDAFKLLIGE